MSILDVFDSWQPLAKDRPEALSKSVEAMSERLQGKSTEEISFSCVHPAHEGEMVKHVLGSVEGNTHFLMGFGSPAFHLAPYHLQLIDPELTDEIAKSLCEALGHPSNTRLWDTLVNEGDFEKGLPHPGIADILKAQEEEEKGLRVSSGAGKYRAVPEEQMVYSTHNDHRYRWDLVQDSYFAATNPKIAEAMNTKKKIKKSRNTYPEIPEMVKHRCEEDRDFSDQVYPLVRADFPKPGTIMSIPVEGLDPVYGVVKAGSIDFYDAEGSIAEVKVYDRKYTGFDLKKGGNVHPSILYNFASKYLAIDDSLIKSIVEEFSVEEDTTSSAVVGAPSPGSEELSSYGS